MRKILMSEETYADICRCLTDYEEGNKDAVHEIYSLLVSVQNMYEGGEEE